MADAGSDGGGEGGIVRYEEFIGYKRLVAPPVGIAEPPELNPKLFPFQRDIVRWALKRGRAAIWADCGLGKTPMALEWAKHVCAHTGGNVLILTPLAVAQQFVSEGEKFGVPVKLCRIGDDVEPGVNVTNYERIHHFDPASFAGVVADESSILKDYTSATRNMLIESFARTPFRLACTATPAPNDQMELGNHAEFLGVMTRTEMLAMFFTHDGGETQTWRLKGHAQKDFWRWVCSWAVNIRAPSDLGYYDDGFILPELRIHERVVSCGDDMAKRQGALFTVEARSLDEQRAARRASMPERVAEAARIVNAEPSESWLVWCDLNAESEALTTAITDAVEVTGSDSVEHKETTLHGFTKRSPRVLVSKPSLAGWGMNWQHCARVVFVGLSHSFEAWYQAIRRTYRFGQTRPVECYVVTSDAEGAVVANLKRKQSDAETMALGMVEHMRDITRAELSATKRDSTEYRPTVRMVVPEWVGREDAA